MLIAATPLAQQMMGGGGHMDWDNGTSWGMVSAMIVVTVLIVGVIVWAVVYATRRTERPGTPIAGADSTSGPSARELLDQRYARGEIDTTDYEERRTKLG